VGAPRDLYDRPASRYVADFIGETNLLPGTVVESGEGMATLRMDGTTLRGVSDAPLAPGGEAWLTVRPEAIDIVDGPPPAGSNAVTGTVADAVYAGAALRVHVALPGGRRVVANVPSATRVTNGATVTLAWPVEQGRCVGD
jgi:ABC-type Fe3+/spermidine/putrescine transport system ATPase subunit